MERLKPTRYHPFPLGLAAPLVLAAAIAGAAARPAAAQPAVGNPGLRGLAELDAAQAAAAVRAGALPGEPSPIAERVDPDTYRAGPGDEFAFRGSDLLDPKIVRIGPTGEILLPDVGAVMVAGMTLREMEEHVRELLRPYVRGKGFLLTLQRPRRFRAVVVGDVERPGAVVVQAPVRASDVIEAAGGVTWRGARRGIVLRRQADSVYVDLLRYERRGDLTSNPLVFETDVLVVPTSSSRVRVGGAVAWPGEYDLAPGDRASTLLAVAGGLLDRAAADRITLSREGAAGRREERPIAARPGGGDRAAAEAGPAAPGDSPGDPLLEPGDQLFVPERAHFGEGSRVEVLGEVLLPGPYAITDGVDRFTDLIGRFGGFTAWADSGAVRIERASDAAERDSAFLRLAREQDALLPAGERGYVVAVIRAREALSLGRGASRTGDGDRGSWDGIALLDGDRVVVPRRSLTVMVQGEVKAPGHVAYVPGGSVADYVRAAGGYTGRANRGRARVTLAATGRPVNAGDVDALQAGDVVWVPAREPRSFWGSIRDVLTTAAQTATIYLVVREATR